MYFEPLYILNSFVLVVLSRVNPGSWAHGASVRFIVQFTNERFGVWETTKLLYKPRRCDFVVLTKSDQFLSANLDSYRGNGNKS